jgi:putative flippase GtrA
MRPQRRIPLGYVSEKAHWMSLRREVWRFGAIGSVGFLIDASVLTWLVTERGWGLYESRMLSFALAVTATWYLNRRVTFANRVSIDRAGEYGRYFAVQIVGALLNLGVYVAILATTPSLAAYPAVPLAVGSGVAMIFNFVWARHFAFSGLKPYSSG